MTYSRHFILIDENSGFVWGDALAADPIAACRAVDASVGETSRLYDDIGSGARFDGRSGYHVYEAPDGWTWPDGLGDGQNQGVIDAVAALPCVTRIVKRDLDGDGQPSRI